MIIFVVDKEIKTILNTITMKEFTFKTATTTIALARVDKAKELIANGAKFNGTIYGKKGNSHSVDMEVYVDGEKIALGRYDKGLTDTIKAELLDYLTSSEVEEVAEEVVKVEEVKEEVLPEGYENRTELWVDNKDITLRDRFVKLTLTNNNLTAVNCGGSKINGGSYELSKLTEEQKNMTLAGLKKYMSGLEHVSYSIGFIKYDVK